MKGLKPKQQRVCRFCGKKYGEVFFKKDAHVLSKLLGNKFLLSDFECDECNSIFSKYETNLSNFIGPIRAFQKLYGCEVDYKFKSPDKKKLAENFSKYGLKNSFSIEREDVESQTFEFDRKKGQTIINLIKHSYLPLSVYKSILKMALCCLSDSDIQSYYLAFAYLHSNELDDQVKGVANILIYSTPPGTGYKSPIATLYRKKENNKDISTHVFMLYFMNQVYQVIIPLNENDLKFYNNQASDILYCPPLFYNSVTADTMPVNEQYLDMDSMDLIKGEKEVFTIQYDKNDYSQGKVYDPKTGEIKESGFDENAVVKIIFSPPDSHLDIL